MAMEELQRQAQSFEQAVKDRRVSPDDFHHLNQAIARAENELPPLTTSEADAPAGAGAAVKLRALVERHGSDTDTLFSHPQANRDLRALLPELDEAELRDFVREFVRELDRRHVRCERSQPLSIMACGLRLLWAVGGLRGWMSYITRILKVLYHSYLRKAALRSTRNIAGDRYTYRVPCSRGAKTVCFLVC